jgi:HAD superfamily hydrolase (TIGR01484 family)
MRRLSELHAADVVGLTGIVFDLDGTLLTDGELTPSAFEAMHALAATGLELVVCTGRPAAWGEVVQRQWPVALTVTENGAIAYRSDGQAVARLDRLAPDARGRRRAALLTVVEQLVADAPELVLADDNLGRLSDVTFDIGERERVPADAVAAVRARARRLGAHTFASSIHLHVTLDSDDKASGTVRALGDVLGVDATAARSRFAFIGDSGNDEACFGAFRLTFGVDNVRAHLRSMSMGPRFVSHGRSGEGFAEIAARLIALRNSSPRTKRSARSAP